MPIQGAAAAASVKAAAAKIAGSKTAQAAVGAGSGAASEAAAEAAQRAKQASMQAYGDRVERLKAKQRAIKYAEQTGSRLAKLQFEDGAERWVVFKGSPPRPIASYPAFAGDLTEALRHHQINRARLRAPRAVAATLPLTRARNGLSKTRQHVHVPRISRRADAPSELPAENS